MIKFFRSIRRRLVSQNRFSKYLLYAFGEIILVVIGILIALRINNWNQENKDRMAERKYLISLRSNLISDSINLSKANRTQESFIKSGERLLDFIEKGEVKDSLQLKTDIMFAGYLDFFDANLSTYNELINSGNLKMMLDKDLKELLYGYTSWLNMFEERKDIVKKMAWEDYRDYYQKNYIKDGRMIKYMFTQNVQGLNSILIDWNNLKNDVEFKSYLTYALQAGELNKVSNNTTMEHVLTLKTHIDSLLNH